LLSRERDFAENSPMPPPEFAEHGVYCSGDDCHKVRPKWERPVAEVTPPKSGVAAVWSVAGFGSGKSSSGGSAPIHFGDTQKAPNHGQIDSEVPEAVAESSEAARLNPRAVKSANAKSATKKSSAAKSKGLARKARR
jgi:hypothetical protein